MILDAIQQRVLGSLIEKEITTPEGYPLSLNALLNACNQRSSRDPVLDLEEEQVRQALHALGDLGLTTPVRDSRVPKYEHRARTALNLRRDETALICLLLLRGPQTPGELRSRADRLFAFDDLAAVQSALERLAGRSVEADAAVSRPVSFAGPLVMMLQRQPGSREARYAHLLGETPAFEPPAARSSASMQDRGPEGRVPERMSQLELEVAGLQSKVEALALRLADLESR